MKVNAFEGALLATLMEDAEGKPCVACQAQSQFVCTWIPTKSGLVRDFDIRDGRPRTIVYPVCYRCTRKARGSPAFAARIQQAVVAILRDPTRPDRGVSIL